MKTSPRFAATALLVACCAVGAADLPKEGRFEYTACWSGTSHQINYSKGYRATSYEMTGSLRSNPPGSLFDKNTFRCVGTDATFDGKLRSATTSCESVDPDGDKRMSYFTMADGNTVREHVAGSGKYEGMTMTSTVTSLGPFPPIKDGTFQGCNQQNGTYRLK